MQLFVRLWFDRFVTYGKICIYVTFLVPFFAIRFVVQRIKKVFSAWGS